MVARPPILRGAKPADIPVGQPTKFDLIINLTAARAARSRDPAHPLARPDEVISRRSGLLRCLSPVGTNLPIRHVRYTAAFRGNPDIEPTRPRAVLDPKRPITLRGMETAGLVRLKYRFDRRSRTAPCRGPVRWLQAGQCPAVGSLSSQSDQPSARSQSLIKPRCKRPSRNACLPQINRQNQLLCE